LDAGITPKGKNCFLGIFWYNFNMKKITVRGREILKNIFRGIGVSVASLIIPACPAYGMPPPVDGTSLYGKVVSKETEEPIFGIKVSVDGTEFWEYTDIEGGFYFWVPIQDVYKIIFEDVDGPYHGGLFQGQIWTLSHDDTYNSLLVDMELDTGSAKVPGAKIVK
jgi:hypothetical protein